MSWRFSSLQYPYWLISNWNGKWEEKNALTKIRAATEVCFRGDWGEWAGRSSERVLTMRLNESIAVKMPKGNLSKWPPLWLFEQSLLKHLSRLPSFPHTFDAQITKKQPEKFPSPEYQRFRTFNFQSILLQIDNNLRQFSKENKPARCFRASNSKSIHDSQRFNTEWPWVSMNLTEIWCRVVVVEMAQWSYLILSFW